MLRKKQQNTLDIKIIQPVIHMKCPNCKNEYTDMEFDKKLLNGILVFKNTNA